MEDEDNVTTNDELKQQFGPLIDIPVDEILEKKRASPCCAVIENPYTRPPSVITLR